MVEKCETPSHQRDHVIAEIRKELVAVSPSTTYRVLKGSDRIGRKQGRS